MSVPMDRVAIITEMARRRMSCNQLVELSGVSRVTVTAVRSGKSCSQETADKLVAVLGHDIIKQEVRTMTINAQYIETRLAELGITKKALAAKCGICAQNVSTIIRRGTCEPKTAGKLAAGLGVPVAEIIREETRP